MCDLRGSSPGASMIPVRNAAVVLLVTAIAGSAPSRVGAQGGDTATAHPREAHHWTGIPQGIGPDGVREIRVEQLLQAFGWDTLRAACPDSLGYSRVSCSATSRSNRDQLLVYHTLRFRDRTSVDVTSFDGRVVRYRIFRVERRGIHLQAQYSNPTVWTEYAHRALDPAGEGLHIAPDAYPAEVVEAYYHLLGVEVDREYGWICEYSTVGSAPAQRRAVMRLIQEPNFDLLRRLLRAPDVETRLYAADALLYLRSRKGEVRKEFEHATPAELQEILERYQLTAEDLRLIEELRRSNEMVRTCGNNGSYKIYLHPAREVLNDSEVRSIPANYAWLRSLGYGR
jgi:hypothetical protein